MIEVAIIGGGVSGLWALNRLLELGYDAHLYERTALGTEQTIAAQGIIHGGLKYALLGAIPAVARTLSAMPQRWKDCLGGCGEIDLRAVTVLCQKHELRLQNRIIKLPIHTFPEPVIDCKSLLTVLRDLCPGHVHQGEAPEAGTVIHCAGIGNEAAPFNTQRRPLRMFMARPSPFGAPVYLHWVGRRNKPMMTVTTHRLGDEWIAYLGGSVAERAVGMQDHEAIDWAVSEAQYRFPNYNWKALQWAIHDVDRAEPDNGGTLPDGPTVRRDRNRLVAWPCKLAAAPLLADALLKELPPPSGKPVPVAGPVPPVALTPWESAVWRTV